MSALMNRHYQRHRPPEYFQWQYFEYPSKVFSSGCFQGTELLGMFGLQRKELTNFGPIDQVVDIIIEQAHRGRGIFLKLWQHVTKQIESGPQFIIGNRSGGEACIRRLGFRRVLKIDQFCAGPNLSLKQLEVEPPSARLGFEMNTPLRRWRFERNPFFSYQQFDSIDGSQATAKIFRPSEESPLFGDIVHYGFQDQTANAIALAYRHLSRAGCDQITTWALPGSGLRESLLSAGFEVEPQERLLCVGGVSAQSELLRPDLWHILQCDTEHF